jgi:hypothetical protein
MTDFLEDAERAALRDVAHLLPAKWQQMIDVVAAAATVGAVAPQLEAVPDVDLDAMVAGARTVDRDLLLEDEQLAVAGHREIEVEMRSSAC